MKRLLIALIVLAGAGVGGYYVQTGRLPWAAPSQEEILVAAQRTAFDVVREQWKQAGRAGTFGMDTGTVTETPLVKLERLEADLAALLPRLTSPEARKQAGQLRQDIATFKAGMR